MTGDIATVAEEEITRQTVILVFSAVGVLITVWIMEGVTKPDTYRTLRMGMSLWAKRFCQKEADRWQLWADNAASAYNREKA
jgi:hypothetical protein